MKNGIAVPLLGIAPSTGEAGVWELGNLQKGDGAEFWRVNTALRIVDVPKPLNL